MRAATSMKHRVSQFRSIAVSIAVSLVACLGTGSARGLTLDACKNIPKVTPKAPYTLACSGKAECMANDTLTVSPAASETAVIEAMCLDFGDGALIWLPPYGLDKPPQLPLSYPLTPLFIAAITADAVDNQSTSAKLRSAFRRAAGAKLVADVVIVDKQGKAFRQQMAFDMASLWSSRQLTAGVMTAECDPCRLDGVLTLRAPGLAAWRQSAGMDAGKVQLVLNGTRMPGLPAHFGSGKDADSVTFKLQRLRDKPESMASWDALLKNVLARNPKAITVALADDRGEVAAGPTVLMPVMSFEDRLGAACLLSALLLTVLGVFGSKSKWAWLRDDFEVPSGVHVGHKGRKFSLGKVQMAAWSVVVAVGLFLVGLSLHTPWVLEEINDTVVILLGISTTTAAGAMALVPDAITRQVELLKVALPADQPRIRQTLSTLLTSQGLLSDILSDVGSGSASFHRLQNVAVTFVLIVMFLLSAMTTGSFPSFTGPVLALMGVSGGAYLGFKAAAR